VGFYPYVAVKHYDNNGELRCFCLCGPYSLHQMHHVCIDFYYDTLLINTYQV
jgi:hypothetical protein